MRILIIEDEFHAVKRLRELVTKIRPNYEVIDTLDSISACVKWFEGHEEPDLIFQDIQLGDGLSFDIFNHKQINVPIIFTTAFDEYAIKAFKTNSIDYLLKPIDDLELEMAIQKFEKWFPQENGHHDSDRLMTLLSNFQKPNYLDRLVTKTGNHLQIIKIADTALFCSEQSLSFVFTHTGQKHMVNHTMDQLQTQLDPKNFFRINRANILNIDAIKKVSPYFNNRLSIETHIPKQENIYVSRERVKDFRSWLGDFS
ncbi:MAG: response regulator transcription factor [Saprospiraceae bacterium]|nr:response regulator transcription factor [Saprospiraceae bacterium]MBP7644225.1 response regulator transcription factor [Saprospiraceae bacterium]HOY12773.1 LytTR family DNA-binding domain-containing protein [Saprospiraceae bacterium]HPN68563.1 LytTR family DNA-binding domain-containing protein [Saprospiraceae bacterium]